MTDMAIAWLDAAKRRVALIGVALVVLAALGSTLVGTTLLMASSTGADVRTAFNDPTLPPREDAELVSWVEGPELLRSLEPATRQAIETAWLRALYSVDIAVADGDLNGVDVWFSGPAKADVLEVVALDGVRQGPEWSSHVLTPTFYSVDGQLLRLDIESRGSLDVDHDEFETTDRLRVILMLRDGNWRVEHLVRTDGS